MVSLLLRPIIFLAALIASWFVARDAINFNIIEMVVALFLITIVVAIGAFWETLSDWFHGKSGSDQSRDADI